MFGWLKNIMGGARLSGAPPIPRGPLPEQALRQALERPCAPIVFDRPATIDPFTSMFGAIRLSRKDEVWPEYEGTPLWPLCQINLTQAPILPQALSDLALLTVFISPEHAMAPTQIINTAKADPNATWALRSYTTLDRLTIPKQSAHGSTLSPRLGEWADVTADYANHDVAGQVVDTTENDVYGYEWCKSVQQTKLGGWPLTAQSEPWWGYQKSRDTWDFVMQIENEPNAGWHGWGDGVAFIARSRQRPHLWAIDVQFT